MSRPFPFSLGTLFVGLFAIAGGFWAWGYNVPLIAVGTAWCITLAVSWTVAVRPQVSLRTVFRLTASAAAFCAVRKLGFAVDFALIVAVLLVLAPQCPAR